MPSILIVDDQTLARQGLKQMLRHEFRDLVLSEAQTADEAITCFARQPWDIVILEVAIAGQCGFSILNQIRNICPSTRVLVLSADTELQSAIRARQMGASGFVCKSASRADHLKAFKSVLAGDEYFGDFSTEVTARHARLSAREYTVMLAFAEGKRMGAIAADLNLSVKTVSTYKRRLLDKLELHTTAELVRYVLDRRLT
jgi:two-component system, NarL family, invasion response regulator UvrY